MNTKSNPPVTFMFPGLGDQYINMGAQLYQEEEVFRQSVDLCCELLMPYMDLNLRDVIYPRDALQYEQLGSMAPKPDLSRMLGRSPSGKNVGQLKDTSLAQPALFVMEYALTQLWYSWGIRPAAMIGYSLGEYVAAAVANVLSLEESLRLVAYRAQLINELPPGAMLAVALPEQRVVRYLNNDVSLSAINGLMMCVVAGQSEAVSALQQRLTTERIACRQIQATHAFHSHMMDPATDSLVNLVKSFDLQPPQIPYISNVTGRWITPKQAIDPAYWASHMRQPVRLARGIEALWAGPSKIFLEVGIGQTLGSLVMQHPARRRVAEPMVLFSLPSTPTQDPDSAHLLRSLGHLQTAGVSVDKAHDTDTENSMGLNLSKGAFA